MKYKKIRYLFLPITFLMLPASVLAVSYNDKTNLSSLININAIIQSGAVVNDTSDSGNLNIIIIGMIVVILILVAAVMFAPKK